MKYTTSKAAQLPWFRMSFFIFSCAFLIIVTGLISQKIWHKLKPSQAKKNEQVKNSRTRGKGEQDSKQLGESSEAAGAKTALVPASPVKPSNPVKPVIPKPITHHLATSGGDIRRMSKGFTLKTKFTVDKEGDLASKIRKRKDSYVATYELKITLPKPSVTLEALEKVNPGLGKILPGLKDAMPRAQVSSFFYQSYNNKVKRIKAKMTSLSDLMTQHNFYDCETILNLKHPQTGRRAILLQSEMDVVSDGSDGDRLPTMPAKIVNSSYYQPMTGYGWKKTTKTPNPLIAGWRGRIQKANAEIARKGTTSDRKTWLRARIKKIKREIQDMECRSYLIAEYDPFIVMPINMITSKSDRYAAKIGDYAVVVYKGKIYPTIVGDAGPSFKTGEASLRIAKQLNARAGIYSRPVSDLTVTYLIFPKTAEKPHKAPDYAHWKQRCEELLEDFGGLGENVSLFTWEDTLPKIESEKKPDTESKDGEKKEGGVKDAAKAADDQTSTEEGAQKGALTPQKKSGTPNPPEPSKKKDKKEDKGVTPSVKPISKSPSMPLPAGVTVD